MKEYLMKFDEKGKPTFFDEQDRAPYRVLLSSLRKSNKLFVMTISLHEPKDITQNQKKLFNVLVNLIANESGNDIRTIEETLIKNFRKDLNSIEDFSKELFSQFIEFIIVFSNETFDTNISQDTNGNFEIKNIR